MSSEKPQGLIYVSINPEGGIQLSVAHELWQFLINTPEAKAAVQVQGQPASALAAATEGNAAGSEAGLGTPPTHVQIDLSNFSSKPIKALGFLAPSDMPPCDGLTG